MDGNAARAARRASIASGSRRYTRAVLRIVLIAILALIAAIAVAAYFLRPEPPMMPRDADHLAHQTEKQCLTCHGPGEESPRKPTHPNANDCFRCHLVKPAT